MGAGCRPSSPASAEGFSLSSDWLPSMSPFNKYQHHSCALIMHAQNSTPSICRGWTLSAFECTGRLACTIEPHARADAGPCAHFGLLLFVHINIKACPLSSSGESSWKSLADPSSLPLQRCPGDGHPSSHVRRTSSQ